MTTSNARHAVLYTTELLEQIFEQMACRDVLVCQMVCRQFRDVVVGSKTLQQQLFFDIPDCPGNASPQLCPLLRKVEPSLHSKAPRLRLGEFRCFLDNIKLPARLPGSWRRMHISVPPPQVVSAEVSWAVDDAHGSRGRTGHCTTLGPYEWRAQSPSGFTLGSMLDAALGWGERTSGWTRGDGGPLYLNDGTASEILIKIEDLLGGQAYVERVDLRFRDPSANSV